MKAATNAESYASMRIDLPFTPANQVFAGEWLE